MIINVKVMPNSGREEIQKISGKEYRVYLKKPAFDNKANMELITLLRKHFKSQIKIIKGTKSRNKVVEIKCR